MPEQEIGLNQARFALLSNYSRNCPECYGRGYIGKIDDPDEGLNNILIPCHKCRGKSNMILDLKTGILKST